MVGVAVGVGVAVAVGVGVGVAVVVVVVVVVGRNALCASVRILTLMRPYKGEKRYVNYASTATQCCDLCSVQ